MRAELPRTEIDSSTVSHDRVSAREALAKMTADRLTPVRIAMVEAALEAFEVDSIGFIIEL